MNLSGQADYNTIIGDTALGNISGAAMETTAVGQNALGYMTQANTGNTAIGYGAGTRCGNGWTASNNTFLGKLSGWDNSNNFVQGSNNVFIGFQSVGASGTVNNTITLGNSSIASLRCQVTTISALSDMRDKKDIETSLLGLDFINKLRPVTFTWNMRQPDEPELDSEGNVVIRGRVGDKELGFIAQELLAVEQESGLSEYTQIVSEDNPDRLEAAPGKLLPIMVKAIQELSAEVANLKAQLAAQN